MTARSTPSTSATSPAPGWPVSWAEERCCWTATGSSPSEKVRSAHDDETASLQGHADQGPAPVLAGAEGARRRGHPVRARQAPAPAWWPVRDGADDGPEEAAGDRVRRRQLPARVEGDRRARPRRNASPRRVTI